MTVDIVLSACTIAVNIIKLLFVKYLSKLSIECDNEPVRNEREKTEKHICEVTNFLKIYSIVLSKVRLILFSFSHVIKVPLKYIVNHFLFWSVCPQIGYYKIK